MKSHLKVTLFACDERFPYKEEVTGSNPVAPTRVFQKSLHIYSKKKHKRHTKNANYIEILLIERIQYLN